MILTLPNGCVVGSEPNSVALKEILHGSYDDIPELRRVRRSSSLNNPFVFILMFLETLFANPCIFGIAAVAFVKDVGVAGLHEFGPAEFAMIMIPGWLRHFISLPLQLCAS